MNEQKHTNYSANDIERYHQGGMSSKEMHDLEKAALDDPFLADALEGYTTAPVNKSGDILLLKKRLDERINTNKEGKIVPLQQANRSWLRIAALLILIAGTGIITYQYVLKGKTSEVAKTETIDLPKANQPVADTPRPAPAIIEKADALTDTQKPGKPVTVKTVERKEEPAIEKESNLTARADSLVNNQAGIISQPGRVPKAEDKKSVLDNETPEKSDRVAAKATNTKTATGNQLEEIKDDKLSLKRRQYDLKETTVNRNFSTMNAANIFRGQVLDPTNNPLPFANITNVEDHVGTYSDAKGYFVLVSPDSVLNVQVRSVGFENNISQLRNNVSGNAVVLQPDTNSIAPIVISNRKVNTERKQEDNMVLEEPEPSDGWYNYDTYLANNIKVPDDIKTKKAISGDVELSFSVNKYGSPVNIKVEKSVCKECDAEAIRLLKDGPKWKKKKKNLRAKVAVAF